MKQIIIILIIFNCSSIFGQELLKTIKDQLPNKERVKQQLFEKIYSESQETITEEKEALNFLIANKKVIDRNKLINVSSLFCILAQNSKHLEIKQEAIYHSVDMTNLIGGKLGFYISDSLEELFTEKTIRRIADIIEKGISNEELDILFQIKLTGYKKFKHDEEDIEELVKSGLTENEAVDSLNKKWEQHLFNVMKKSHDTPWHLVEILARLDKTEYAPMLEQKLDSSDILMRHSAMLALARFDYKDYREKYIREFFNPVVRFLFDFDISFRIINSIEALWDYIGYNDSYDVITVSPGLRGNNYSTSISIAVANVSRIVEGFPIDLVFYPKVKSKTEIPSLIEKTKKSYGWLKENKNKISFRKIKEMPFCL